MSWQPPLAPSNDMASDERDGKGQRDLVEERLLRRLRVISGAVILVMIGLLVVVDTLGRLLINPDFHASELFLGTLIGALLLLLGVEGINRLPGFGGRK
jgi:hypothetical protein